MKIKRSGFEKKSHFPSPHTTIKKWVSNPVSCYWPTTIRFKNSALFIYRSSELFTNSNPLLDTIFEGELGISIGRKVEHYHSTIINIRVVKLGVCSDRWISGGNTEKELNIPYAASFRYTKTRLYLRALSYWHLRPVRSLTPLRLN